MKRRGLVMAAIGLALALCGARASADAKTTVEEVRQELWKLPYYGVFDYLAFTYNRGTLTLMGYAYAPGLSRDAERAVKRASGIDTVVNKIEELPASQFDDELRWRVFYKIYQDPFLSRYAPGGGLVGPRRGFGRFGMVPGTEPFGDFPIRIIVKRGRATLLGVVDNQGDKTVAGLRTREVPGTLAVKNELQVEHAAKGPK
jgi:hypothetical protein